MNPAVVQSLKSRTSAIISDTLDKLLEVSLGLSRKDEDTAVWGEQFIKEIEQKCSELLGDIETLGREIAEKVDASVVVLEGLCKRLQVEAPKADGDRGLYEKLAQIEEWISGYKEQVDFKMAEIDVLLEQERSLCRTLGRRPTSLQTDPLPFKAQLKEFEEHLRLLEAEITLRNRTVQSIKNMIVLLDYTPQTDFERVVCSDDFFPVDDCMAEFDRFYENLKEKVSKMKAEVRDLRDEIEQLWNVLCVDLLEREEVKKSAEGCDWRTLKVLRGEKERCRTLKIANLEKFVTSLRNDLEETWKKCHCPDTIKEKFEYFDTDWFSEALLEMHENELKTWQDYYEKNKELLKLIEKHNEQWKKMVQLEENSVNPDRFKNRGGQLLKEEKERKALSKKIPELEEEIRRLAGEYKSTNGKEFTTYGSTVEEYIGSLYAGRENLKMQKLSSRKQKLTPGKLAMSSALKLTPSCKRKLLTPAKTPIADKMIKPTVDAKVQADICINVPDIKLKPAGIMSPKQKRLSFERNRRLKKLRKHLRPTVNDGDTEIFSSTLTESSPCRNFEPELSPDKQ